LKISGQSILNRTAAKSRVKALWFVIFRRVCKALENVSTLEGLPTRIALY
jgi:hypothetical protein